MSALSHPATKGRQLVALGLMAVAFVTALGVVYAQHSSRKLFIELEQLQKASDELDIEWGRLQLEQSTWARDGRIDAAAREKLEMLIPPPAEVVIVKP